MALIAGLPGIIAAVAALRVQRQVATGNGRTLGQSVEQTRGVVTRTLGERRGDKPPELRNHDQHNRMDD